MMSAKMATLGLLKTKVFYNIDFEIIISVQGITNKILHLTYIVHAAM